MLNRKMKPIAAAVGAAFAASLAPAVAEEAVQPAETTAADPFETRALDGVLFAKSHGEGGCGEDAEKPAEDAEGEGGKEGMDEGNCGEGNCGEDKEKGEESGDSDESEDDAPAEE